MTTALSTLYDIFVV